MKLTDFENEQALDLLADIIEPAAMIMGDAKVKEMVDSRKPVLLIASYILKNHKKQVIKIEAIMHGKTPETVRFNTATLIKDVVDIFNDSELVDLFTSQGQMKQEGSSGSATENITVDGQ